MDMTNNVINEGMLTERFPFRVEIASKQDLWKVAALRAKTYGRHLPEFAAQLREPEPVDFEEGCEVFVAISKLDGSVLGSLRTHTNAFHALPVQSSMVLPSRFNGARMVETNRLSIAAGVGSSVVRSALFKALHQYCLLQKADWMLAEGRRPVDRIYDGLLFKDVAQPNAFYPLLHAQGVPHRVMCLSPQMVCPLWSNSKHALFEFFFKTQHPDIDLTGMQLMDFPWKCPLPETGVSFNFVQVMSASLAVCA